MAGRRSFERRLPRRAKMRPRRGPWRDTPRASPTFATMTDPLYDEPSYLTELPEDLKLKRAAAARRRRWRRRLALAALVAVVGAVVALVATAVGGGGRLGSRRRRRRSRRSLRPPGPERDWPGLSGGLGAASRARCRSSSTTRSRPPATGETVPGAVRPSPRTSRPRCSGSTTRDYEAVTLDQVEDAWYEDGKAAAEADRDQLRRRLSQPVRERLRGAGEARLAGRAQPRRAGLRAARRRRREDARRRLGAGLEGDHQRRSDHRRLDHAGARGGGLAADPAASASVFRWTTSAIRSAATTTTVISAVHRAGYVGAQTEIAGHRGRRPSLHHRSDRDPALGRRSAGFISKLQSAGALWT